MLEDPGHRPATENLQHDISRMGKRDAILIDIKTRRGQVLCQSQPAALISILSAALSPYLRQCFKERCCQKKCLRIRLIGTLLKKGDKCRLLHIRCFVKSTDLCSDCLKPGSVTGRSCWSPSSPSRSRNWSAKYLIWILRTGQI